MMVRSTPDAYSDAFGKRNHGDIDDDGIPVEKHDLLKKAESTLGLHMSKKAHILLTNLDFPAVRRMQLRPGYAAKTDIPSLVCLSLSSLVRACTDLFRIWLNPIVGH